MSPALRVVVADDHALARAGVRMILESQPDIAVVGEAGDGHAAVAAADRLRPDVVLMDTHLPRLDGVAATRRLAAHRVLLLTSGSPEERLVEALRAGARGFLLKHASAGDLVAAVRAVAAGDMLLSPAATRALFERIAPMLHLDAAPPPSALGELTERELDVLRLLARGLSNGEIAAQLFVSGATVKTHVSHLLRKLCLRDRVQAVVFAYDSGLVQPRG
ncbi:response regulator [Conexibacter woesei]|uniref:Two component transcriptional regulator, LuxR family n=1 Tax=Conexibacter woesei (strain DSM 14684 / CCUG 47730 / CIP 108061 / JCM 11494 / NBRC 100937 / ID131577) TaxID=469383 RepID=D3F616_CONWI|nr:response regulator transcription factor [Conexibacter woesei]ADB48689.1 two component transcriptional regulator, LuxR family [Conexibacter woesei DSM 14684]